MKLWFKKHDVWVILATQNGSLIPFVQQFGDDSHRLFSRFHDRWAVVESMKSNGGSMLKYFFPAIVLMCFVGGCRRPPGPLGEDCFTPANNSFTDISEVCKRGVKPHQVCYLRKSNGTKEDILCKQFDMTRRASGGGL